MSDRHPHASFAGVHFRLDDFDPARQEDANRAYGVAREDFLAVIPPPPHSHGQRPRLGFPEALRGLEGFERAREQAFLDSLASDEPRFASLITDGDDEPNIDLEHERLVRSTLARLDHFGTFSNSLLAQLQVHWAARWRRTVLTVPSSGMPRDLRFDELAQDLTPTRRRFRGRSDLEPLRREIRIAFPPPEAPSGAGSRAPTRIPFDTETLCTPLGWRALIGVACLVRLVTEAEIAAEIGSVRLKRCESPRCDAWFIIQSPGGGRPRTFCGPRCRVAALRARRDATED